MKKTTLASVIAASIAAAGATSLAASVFFRQQRMFSPAEISQIQKFWKPEGRYVVGVPPTAERDGRWVVRLTPEASKWLWDYNRARGLSKGPPSQIERTKNPDEPAWEAWIEAKVIWDRWQAANAARAKNLEETGKELPAFTAAPPDPGPTPESLVALNGEPPPFAAAVRPSLHTIEFDDGTKLAYADNVPMRHRYAYYRFPQGVMDAGKRVATLPQKDLDALFEKAGLSPSVQRIMKVVSLLEGGFESVNTYDTGFVSVGLIQFACLKDGAGSLGRVLLRYKQSNPLLFENDFRRFGLDVNRQGALVAVDIESGQELVGAAAAMQIIEDKRLIAVFQRAGIKSEAFRLSQIVIAKEQYYPDHDVVTISVPSGNWNVKVSDIIRSEAGMATLMDRKVNTGKLDPLPSVLSKIAVDFEVTDPKQFADFEALIVAQMKFRKDYLTEVTLSQPRELGSATSRGGDPKRGGGKPAGKP